MRSRCELCGKGVSFGHNVSHSNHKSARTWKPNVQKTTIMIDGNAWAFDNYARRLVVVRTGPGQFCAITRYLGNFTTNAGTSPGGTGTVPDGLTGSFAGGYRTTTFRTGSSLTGSSLECWPAPRSSPPT